MRRTLPVVALLLAVLWLLVGRAPAEAQDGGGAKGMSHGLEGVACVHCHESPHRGAPTATCQDCHTSEAWVPSTFTVERHAATGYPLQGRHTEVACGSCHVRGQLVDLPKDCAGCHVDRHRGKLGGDCATCHSVEGFVPVAGFDHLARTGFALTAPHEGVACADCHQGDHGRALRLVQDVTCETCHAATHADFGPCADCHTAGFSGTGFDHRVTAFALERRHRAQECADCHPVEQVRPPDPRCQSCHVDPHAGQLGTVCADCHRADRWRLVRYDHDLAGWPLRGRHFVTPCGSCHTNQRWVGLGDACWECHALDARRGPATVPAHVTGLSDCGDCHGQWTWR